MKKQLIDLKEAAIRDIQSSESREKIEYLRVQLLGKKGKLTKILKGLGVLSPDERSKVGNLANTIKKEIQDAFIDQEKLLQEKHYQKLAEAEWFDMTAYPLRFPEGNLRAKERGHIHPISLMQEKLENVFISMGFMHFRWTAIRRRLL